MQTSTFLLLFVLAVLILPTIFIYAEHGLHEFEASQKSKESGNENKYLRQYGEGTFFIATAIFYGVMLAIIIIKPEKTIPYYLLIFVTIAIIIVYYLRTTTGIPVVGTGVWIKEYLVDWNDVITKICQQALVVPATVLLMKARYKKI